MKKERFNPIPSELQAEIDALASLPDSEIRTDDIPEVRDWNGAKRGAFYRPHEQAVTLRLDIDVELALIQEAIKLSHHSTEKDVVREALEEYVERRKRLKILDVFGCIEYEEDYDYKQQRQQS